MIKNYILALVAALFCQFSFGQSNYSVSPIPFQQFTATLPVQGTQDDINSNAIQLPFNFDFYGVSYNQIVVSTNGYIDFRTTSANQFSPWSFTQSVPAADFPVKNSILGCFHDMNNNTGLGYINYGIYGTAPYRKFVVVFNNNPQFGCTTATSTIQMILYESQSIIDVQLIDKQICSIWNSGNAVTGLINLAGTTAITAPGRNTGAWTAYHEGWRFARSGYTVGDYQYVKCDGNSDGIEDFNLQVVQNDLVANGAPALTFYANLTDLQTQSNPISGLTYTNLTSPQTIYTMINGMVKSVVLTVIDCGVDYDADTVATNIEDPNNDTNLANDDTDMDGLPNYLDNDDDGDLVLTSVEYVFTNKNVSALMDTDNDGKPNYIDNEDDGDGVLTFMEDYDGDGNPANDDTNNNGVADYLDQSNILSIGSNITENTIKLFPNPVSEMLNIENTSNYNVSKVSIYSISGALVKEINSQNSIQTILVSDLQTGLYFVKIQVNDELKNFKFIKK
jgi:hypothetical protein